MKFEEVVVVVVVAVVVVVVVVVAVVVVPLLRNEKRTEGSETIKAVQLIEMTIASSGMQLRQ